jgi:hypothetical protein
MFLKVVGDLAAGADALGRASDALEATPIPIPMGDYLHDQVTYAQAKLARLADLLKEAFPHLPWPPMTW